MRIQLVSFLYFLQSLSQEKVYALNGKYNLVVHNINLLYVSTSKPINRLWFTAKIRGRPTSQNQPWWWSPFYTLQAQVYIYVHFIHGRCISIYYYIHNPMFFIFLLLNIKKQSWSSMRWRSCSTCCRTSATVQVTSSPTGKGLGSLRVPECSKA